MARLARADLVDPAEIAAFHCIHRCVRRSYLCGEDPYSGRNYDHRKAWLEERFRMLAGLFGIDIVGFAIMSNHFHLVIRSRPDVIAIWSDTEVARRWLMLCPYRKNEWGQAEEPNDAELNTIRNCPERLAEIRKRLSDISWLMRMIAEPVARQANREEKVTGHFWEGRYKCVKLCDEAALLACLAYVDLNPIRAGVATTPETSDFTSVQRRIESLLGSVKGSLAKQDRPKKQDTWLAPLEIDERELSPLPSESKDRASDKGCLPIAVTDYLKLIDWTGRQLARDKQGSIPPELSPILVRLGIADRNWLTVVTNFGRHFQRVAGAARILGELHPYSRPSSTFRPGRAELLSST